MGKMKKKSIKEVVKEPEVISEALDVPVAESIENGIKEYSVNAIISDIGCETGLDEIQIEYLKEVAKLDGIPEDKKASLLNNLKQYYAAKRKSKE